MRADKRFARAFQLAPYNVRAYIMYAHVFQSHVADRLEYARVHYISAYIIRGESEGTREPFKYKFQQNVQLYFWFYLVIHIQPASG